MGLEVSATPTPKSPSATSPNPNNLHFLFSIGSRDYGIYEMNNRLVTGL